MVKKVSVNKLLSLVLGLAMVASCLAACTGAPAQTQAPGQTEAQTGAPAETAATGELPTITYMMPFESGMEINADTMAIQYWAGKVGVKFEIVNPPRDNYQDKVNLALASGSVPDMIHFFRDTVSAGKYGPDMFVSLDTAMSEGKLPDLKKWFDKYPSTVDIMTAPDGHIYGFPQFNDFTWPANMMWCRGDLLQKGGIDPANVKTLEDLENALKTIKDNCGHDYIMFNRNGIANIFGLSMPFFGITQDVYFDDDPGGANQFIFAPATPRFKSYVEFLKYCYDNKILHPDFATMTDDEFDAAYANASVCFAFDNPNGWTDYDGRMSDLLPKDAVAAALLPPAIDGKTYAVRMSSPLNIGFRWPVVISNKSEVIDDCLRAMNFAYTEEGRYNLLYGPEGDWWTFDSTYPGGIKFNMDVAMEKKIMFPQSEAYCKQQNLSFTDVFPDGSPEIVNFGFGWYLSGVINAQDKEGMINYLPGMEDIANMVPNACKFYQDSGAVKGVEPSVVLSGDAGNEAASLRTAIQTYVQENVLLYVTGQKPMSQFDNFVSDLKNMGSDRLVQIYNDALAAKK